MTFEEIVNKVRNKFKNANTEDINEKIAIQINLEGKSANGIFYIEVKNGQVSVEPYEYNDRNAVITTNQTNLLKLMDGKISLAEAQSSGKIYIDGETSAVIAIIELI